MNNQSKMDRFKKALPILLILVAALVLASCRAAETGKEEITECEDGSLACWAVIQPTIFAGSGGCTGCHTGAGAGPSGLSLDADQYEAVVTNGLESGQGGGKMIDASSTDPNDSFLYRKVAGPPDAGAQMPLVGGPLSAGDVATIAEWIGKGSPEF